MRRFSRALSGAGIFIAFFSLVLTVFSSPALADSWSLGPSSVTGTPLVDSTLNVQAVFYSPGGVSGTYMLDTEIFAPNNTKVAQWTENFWLNSSQSITRTYSWRTNGLPAGTYTIHQGVFSSDWNAQYIWNNHTATVNLSTAADTAQPQTGAVQASAALKNAAVTAGVTNTLLGTFSVANSGNYFVMLELYNSGGSRIASWSTNQNLNAGTSQTLGWDFTPAAGTFRVKMGIFSNGWQLVTWNDNALNFSTGSVAAIAAPPPPPPPVATPTPSPAPAPAPPPPPVSSGGRFMRGVNLSGGEFTPYTLPGNIGYDYNYPGNSVLDYYKSKGLTLFRLPFLWERLQPNLYGDLNSTELNRLAGVVSAARDRGMKVILDPHNYGRYRLWGNDFVIGSDQVPVSAFEDFWGKMSSRFRDEPAIFAYSLMNEPHDTGGTWKNTAQAAVYRIRQNDNSHTILAPGDSWSGAWSWQWNNQNFLLNDPANNLMYEAHQYFDRDGSGKYYESYDSNGAYPQIGADRVQPFINWLHANNVRGFISEYGVPNNDDRWLTVLDNFLNKLDAEGIGGTYWAGGNWWNDYALSSDPRWGQDAPVMRILSRHLSQ